MSIFDVSQCFEVFETDILLKQTLLFLFNSLKVLENMSQIYVDDARNIANTCTKHCQNIVNTLPTHLQNIAKTFLKHVQIRFETCPHHV